MPDTPETVLKPPIGYSKLPDGVRCRCIKLWQDAKGAFYCCRSGTPSSATPEVSELIERMKLHAGRLGCYGYTEVIAALNEAATALETLEARVRLLEEALKAFVILERSIKIDIGSAHSGRGAGASEAMREDDRDFRREVETAFDQARAALLKQLSGDGS